MTTDPERSALEDVARALLQADALLASGDAVGALGLCASLLPRWDGMAAVHVVRARALGLLGRRSEACIAATHAVDRDEGSPDAWAALGDAMLAAGQGGAAQSAYAQALTRRDEATLWARLGDALLLQGLTERARMAFDQAQRLDPTLGAAGSEARAEWNRRQR
ncbi:MAG: hypothetical protein AMXMBFR64_08410 [Myxococcales bacterium]